MNTKNKEERITDKGALKSVRKFLENAGVKNDDL
jgi:hypothetical protein